MEADDIVEGSRQYFCHFRCHDD
jgi:hypothetical protein